MDGAAPDVQEKPENVQHVSEQTTQASATTQSESPELVIAPHSGKKVLMFSQYSLVYGCM